MHKYIVTPISLKTNFREGFDLFTFSVSVRSGFSFFHERFTEIVPPSRVIIDTRVGAMLHPITFEKIGRYDRFPSPYNLPLQIYVAYTEYRDQLSLDEFSKKTREILEGYDQSDS